MRKPLRILRYNTGTDKKAFIELKGHFDAVIFNAAIVAYSGSSVADLVSMHKNKYIIDPQTHIFQQDFSAISTVNKTKSESKIKKSIEKYLSQLPHELSTILKDEKRPLVPEEVEPHIDSLVTGVYDFQTKFVDKFIRDKDYDKYLKYVNFYPKPRMVIAPYFMLKNTYSTSVINGWLDINSKCISKTILENQRCNNTFDIAAQLVLDKPMILSNGFIARIEAVYSIPEYEYVFIWVDDFDAFVESTEYISAFAKLVSALNGIGKKPIMAYGGYESIILCNSGSPYRLYGVAQSVGYGEFRPITPVGGGLPVNKYYFLPIHRRLRFDDAASMLNKEEFFSEDINSATQANKYYNQICNCKICHKTIGNDINNFDRYNDSISFNIKTKHGTISRNMPTTDASLISALHFLYCKVEEWKNVESREFNNLVSELKEGIKRYNPQMYRQIEEWCRIYDCKAN